MSRYEKQYLGKSVYEAALERLNFIFDEFEHILISFSGGKDSGVVLNMAIDIAHERKRKIGVMFIDLEAFYKKTIEYVERMFKNNEDVLEPFWVCLPMESPNSVSFLEPTWIWWEPEKKPIWVREMPKNKWVINLDNNPFDFYKRNMPFEEFVKYIGDWYGKGEPTAVLVGIRTTESLNRFRAIVTEKELYKGKKYSTRVSENTWNFYPIYDWTVPDIWTYYGKFKKDYNRLYDLFYRAGVSIYKMRVDEPFGNEAKAGLNLFRVIEPETWAKVVNRVSGANFGNIYHGTKLLRADKFKLPKNHTWKSFTKFLLKTLPESTANVYKEKFIKFIKYWWHVGSPMRDEYIEILERKYSKYIVNTHQFSRRGKGDKYVIRFKRIVDEIPELDTKTDVCTWKRLAWTILKNDIICKSLSFSMTKEMRIRQQQLLEKYKTLQKGGV